MIDGVLTIAGFAYCVLDAKNGAGEPVKVLAFKHEAKNVEFRFVFTTDELEKFIQQISQGTLVIAHSLPSNLIKP